MTSSVTHLPTIPPEVAYFCAEFGLAEGLPFFAGGLGILAGDVIKQAADGAFPLVGVGLFYHGKKDRQIVHEDGSQEYQDYHFNPAEQGFLEVMLAEGQPWSCSLSFGSDSVSVYALAKPLANGNVVYFLETDRPENSEQMRDLTLAPYWGDERQQLRQQLVLGCAGVRLLSDLNILPETIHINEGRPAVLVWEMAALLHEKVGISGIDALQEVKQKVVYTNHTLVRAGNLSYPVSLVAEHVQPWADRLQLPASLLLQPGLDQAGERFEITEFSLQMSRKASGVSERHTKLCAVQWPEFSWVNITNGVHFPTWQRPELARAEQTDHDLWHAHVGAKYQLMEETIRRTGIGYDPNSLILGWARRVTDYKRLNSLFADMERLRALCTQADRPVQLVIAGKAHPGDTQSQELLQLVIQLFQTKLSGIAVFLPNYDIALSQYLVSGVDVWLNTPVDGREACGTSGMKAAANGVLQATVSDGWADEVDWLDMGWTLDPVDPGLHLLDLLEQQMQPLFYDRPDGLPQQWIQRMRRTQKMSEQFSAARMLREYREKLYTL